MHKHKSIVLAVAIIIILFPLVSNAVDGYVLNGAQFSQGPRSSSSAVTSRPFAGRVLLTAPQMASTIVCAAIRGPFTIQPFNMSTFGPYFVSTSALSSNSGAPKSGGYILGLYNSIPNTTTCYNPASGVPLPAFGIKLYSVGGGIGL